MMQRVEFDAVLFRVPGKGGWHFAPIPTEMAPPVTGGWGMTPVVAEVDGKEWKTSVWREKTGRTLLPVPGRVRGGKGDGDPVHVRLAFNLV